MPEYRTFFGLDPRIACWVVAQLHLLFGAFVLGVPIFASVVEVVGLRGKDPANAARYDKLAYEFTKLLSAAFATTAALGGLLTFVLISCYPKFMAHLTHVFHRSFFVYALIFFAEGFTLYTYYYGWNRMVGRDRRPALRWAGLALAMLALGLIVGQLRVGGAAGASTAVLAATALLGLGLFARSFGPKAFHVYLGLALNLFGLAILVIANSWASYMMSPPGLAPAAAGTLETHWKGTEYIGPAWQAFANFLWMPLNIHRFIANIAFGGAICGAYAAVKFLGARSDEDRAHYDWMGYVGSFIAIAGLMPLPFAGYYLGREVYSFNPTMGQDMMGGTFSWAFILQAVFVGTLFIGGNFYLWSGMRRMPGGERYDRAVLPMLVLLVCSFAVWLTPHNLPLGGLEKKFGLMPAKNAVVQLMILVTFVGFMIYRRADKEAAVPFRNHGVMGWIVMLIAVAASCGVLLRYAWSSDLADAVPEIGRFTMASGTTWAATLRWTLYAQMAMVGVAGLTFCLGLCRAGQGLVLATTAALAVVWLAKHGFTVMELANPLVRQVAVCQVLMVLSGLITATAMDLLMFRGARSLGPIRWGQMHVPSQLVLILLCTFFVMNMGLMGYIRSGLRKGWHVVSVMKDSSPWAYTPDNLVMAIVVTSITILFLGMVSFVFWTASLVEPKQASQG